MVDWIVAGLGNPGKRYADSRHNAGFRAVDAFADRHGARFDRKHSRAEIATVDVGGVRVLLAKPQTWMNDSGVSVGELARWHKVTPDRILVVYDEMDLPLGALRIRADGSAGGHNGMKSVIQHLGTNRVPRMRIGVDRAAVSRAQWGGVDGSRGGSARERDDTLAHVLGPFSAADERTFREIILPGVAEAITTLVTEGVIKAMDRHNGSLIPPEAAGTAD